MSPEALKVFDGLPSTVVIWHKGQFVMTAMYARPGAPAFENGGLGVSQFWDDLEWGGFLRYNQDENTYVNPGYAMPRASTDAWTMTAVVQDSKGAHVWRDGVFSSSPFLDLRSVNRNRTIALMFNPTSRSADEPGFVAIDTVRAIPRALGMGELLGMFYAERPVQTKPLRVSLCESFHS